MSTIRSFTWLLSACLLALFSAGCALPEWARNGFKVGPNYSKPPAPVASEWIDYKREIVIDKDKKTIAKLDSDEPVPVEWWHLFNDAALDELIEAAYRQNISLRVAGARILQARAIRGIALGNLMPQLQEAFGSFTRNKLSGAAAHPVEKLYFNNGQLGFNLNWELDFWGRFRRAIESADAELDASIEYYDDVLRILLSDVAANYIQYRTFQKRLVYTEENLRAQKGIWELTKDKFENGATTERDVHQAKQVYEQTAALIPTLETGLRQANNALCILLGFPPRDLAAILQKADIPSAPPEVAVGIPADLLRRRPDVRRAERQVAAQSARIGVAKADFYPRIILIGSIGVSAEKFQDLFHTPLSLFGFMGPSFNWEILNYGRILNRVRFQDALFQELAFAYQQAVLQAGREAEDAIVAFLNAHLEVKHLTESVDEADKTLKIAYLQYKEGAVDYTTVFIFQDRLTQQQDQLAQALGNISLSLVDLYRALGGGWEMRLAREGCGPLGPGPARPGPEVAPVPQPIEERIDRPAVLGAPVTEKEELP